MSRAENSGGAALKLQEIRIAAILARLEAGGPAPRLELLPEDRPAARSPGFFRRFAAVAAGILLVLAGYLAWNVNRSKAADELLAQARQHIKQGIHSYSGKIYLRFFKKGDGQISFTVALGEGKKFHLRFRWPGSKLKGYLEIGNDGKGYWAKGPKGKAFELLYDDKGKLSVRDLSPELRYLEIRPLIETILTEKGLEVLGDEIAKDGKKLVRLEGPFRQEKHRQERLRRPGKRGRSGRQRRGWSTRKRSSQPPRKTVIKVIEGTITLLIEKESGLLREVTQRDSSGRSLFTLRRQAGTEPGDQAWVNFNPPRTRIAAATRLFIWGLNAFREYGKRQNTLERQQEMPTPEAQSNKQK